MNPLFSRIISILSISRFRVRSNMQYRWKIISLYRLTRHRIRESFGPHNFRIARYLKYLSSRRIGWKTTRVFDLFFRMCMHLEYDYACLFLIPTSPYSHKKRLIKIKSFLTLHQTAQSMSRIKLGLKEKFFIAKEKVIIYKKQQ